MILTRSKQRPSDTLTSLLIAGSVSTLSKIEANAGRLVDPDFGCMDEEYSYEDHPKKFLAKLEELNTKRLESK